MLFLTDKKFLIMEKWNIKTSKMTQEDYLKCSKQPMNINNFLI